MTPSLEQTFKDSLIAVNHPLDTRMLFDTPNFVRYRCPHTSKSNIDAGYIAKTDRYPTLIFVCNRCSPEHQSFSLKSNHSQAYSSEQREQFKETAKKKTEAREKQRAAAIQQVNAIWDKATSCISHIYFEHKQVLVSKADGLRIDVDGNLLLPIRLMDVIDGKIIAFQKVYWDKNKFEKRFKSSPKNGFHLLGAIEDHDTIFFAEGIDDCLSIREAVKQPVICVYGKKFRDIAPIIAKAYPDKKLIYCCDLVSEAELKNPKIMTSEDNAKQAIVLVGGTYVLPDFSEIPSELQPDIKRSDFNDLFMLLMAKGLERTAALDTVRQQIQKNSIQGDFMTKDDAAQKENLIIEIKKLVLLDGVAYELIREKTANTFKIRVAKLDEFVNDERAKTAEEKTETVLFPKIEPWSEEIILSTLLNEIVTILEKYVSFNSKHEPKTIALWVIHTYCIDAAYITAVLFITSPEMRSGKSTLLAILQKIVSKCVAASSISPSVIYRIIPKHHPTIICDEADTYMTEKNEDLRGILNAGHSRDTSGVLRTNPDTLEVERFDAFGAKCLAAIKDLPGTVEDRSIIIKMRRKSKEQKTEKLRFINDQLRKEFHDIQRKCVRFKNDKLEDIKKIEPKIPGELNDRATDNWHSLLQIAELAGKEWSEYANDAALSLSGVEQENKSLGIELLEDIQNIFDGKHKDSDDIKTADLIEALCQDDESPWATYNKNRKEPRIDPRQLRKLLKPYDINPKNIIRDRERPKGYCKSDFQDAFSRYISKGEPDFAATSATSAQPNNHGASTENEENNSSATIRSSRYHDGTLSQPEVAVADSSGKERIKSVTKKPSEAPPHIVGADVADKSGNSGMQDYMDV